MSTSAVGKVHSGWHSIFLGVVFLPSHTGFCPEVLGRVKRTLHSKNVSHLQKTVGFLVEFLLPAFRQERVQKRVCSEANKKRLPKAESMKKTLPRTEAVKNVLP